MSKKIFLSDKEYADVKGTVCPVCGSDDLDGGSVDIDAGTATQEVVCLECLSSWTDVYTLTGYADVFMGAAE